MTEKRLAKTRTFVVGDSELVSILAFGMAAMQKVDFPPNKVLAGSLKAAENGALLSFTVDVTPDPEPTEPDCPTANELRELLGLALGEHAPSLLEIETWDSGMMVDAATWAAAKHAQDSGDYGHRLLDDSGKLPPLPEFLKDFQPKKKKRRSRRKPLKLNKEVFLGASETNQPKNDDAAPTDPQTE